MGKNQKDCPAGANPSIADDERTVRMGADLVSAGHGKAIVEPWIEYKVLDTVDLCPGNCGDEDEQKATVALSRMEATGISGDVPFEVNYKIEAESFEVDVREQQEDTGDSDQELDTGVP